MGQPEPSTPLAVLSPGLSPPSSGPPVLPPQVQSLGGESSPSVAAVVELLLASRADLVGGDAAWSLVQESWQATSLPSPLWSNNNLENRCELFTRESLESLLRCISRPSNSGAARVRHELEEKVEAAKHGLRERLL